MWTHIDIHAASSLQETYLPCRLVACALSSSHGVVAEQSAEVACVWARCLQLVSSIGHGTRGSAMQSNGQAWWRRRTRAFSYPHPSSLTPHPHPHLSLSPLTFTSRPHRSPSPLTVHPHPHPHLSPSPLTVHPHPHLSPITLTLTDHRSSSPSPSPPPSSSPSPHVCPRLGRWRGGSRPGSATWRWSPHSTLGQRLSRRWRVLPPY